MTEEITVDDWPNEVEADKLYWQDSKHGETAYVNIMRLFIAFDLDVTVEPIGNLILTLSASKLRLYF